MSSEARIKPKPSMNRFVWKPSHGREEVLAVDLQTIPQWKNQTSYVQECCNIGLM